MVAVSVRVYIEQSEMDSGADLAQRWVRSVLEVQEWDVYVPLEVIEQERLILISCVRLRRSPPVDPVCVPQKPAMSYT